jgi:hypothetical protein
MNAIRTQQFSNRLHDWKKPLLILFLLCLKLSVFAQAQDGISELDDWGEKIVGLIQSGWIEAICALAFAIEAGACIFVGRQEPGLIKKFIPWMVGTVGLLAAPSVTSFFFAAN